MQDARVRRSESLRIANGHLWQAVITRTAPARRRYRSGEEIDLEFAAWVTVALRELRVRNDAWARMLPEHGDAHSRLWADLTRLAQPGYVAAPASLMVLASCRQPQFMARRIYIAINSR
jgi:hypothetical protein